VESDMRHVCTGSLDPEPQLMGLMAASRFTMSPAVCSLLTAPPLSSPDT
jgi:hypothetical protein